MIRVQYRPMPGRLLSQSVRVSTNSGGWMVIGFVRQAGDNLWVARARSTMDGQPSEVGEFRSRAKATHWLLIDGKFAQESRQTASADEDASGQSRSSPEDTADCDGKLAKAA